MSSMLKKTGGLAFKPKVGRRPGAAPASQNTTRAPTTESSQTAASIPSTATPTPTVANAVNASNTPNESSQSSQLESSRTTANESVTPAFTPSKPQESAATPAEQLAPQPSAAKPVHESDTFQNVTSTDPSGNPRGTQETETTSVPQDTTNPVPTISVTPSPSANPVAVPARAIPLPAEPRQPLLDPTPESRASAGVADVEAPTSSLIGTPAAADLRNPAVATLDQSSAVPVSGSDVSASSTAPATENANGTGDFAQANGPNEGASTPLIEAPKKKRQYRKRKQPADLEGAEPAEGEATAAPKPKKPRKKKAPAPVDVQEGEVDADTTTAPPATKRSRRRQVTPDPEDIPEDGRPDHTTTKIGDLTRDLGIGKKFKHADLILERQRQARLDAKLRRLEKQKRAMGLLPPQENQDNHSRAGTPAGNGVSGEPAAARGQGIDFDIIDGQIMINQNSLVINQHAAEGDVQLETVEEDEFTHLTTSASYMRPSRAMGPNHWDEQDTEKFYTYLKMFGTDFETISHMFPTRNRRQIKLKFNREEKARPNRVNAAIMARGEKRMAIDIDEYKATRAGFDETWITPDKFHAEQEEIRKEQEKELEAKRQERRDLGLLEDDPATVTKAGGADGKEANGGEEVEEELIDDADAGGATMSIEAA